MADILDGKKGDIDDFFDSRFKEVEKKVNPKTNLELLEYTRDQISLLKNYESVLIDLLRVSNEKVKRKMVKKGKLDPKQQILDIKKDLKELDQEYEDITKNYKHQKKRLEDKLNEVEKLQLLPKKSDNYGVKVHSTKKEIKVESEECSSKD